MAAVVVALTIVYVLIPKLKKKYGIKPSSVKLTGNTLIDNTIKWILNPHPMVKPSEKPTSKPGKPTPKPTGSTKPTSKPTLPPSIQQGNVKQYNQNKYGYYRVVNGDIPQVGSQYSQKNNVSEAECAKFCTPFPHCKLYNYDTTKRTCKLKRLDQKSGFDIGLKGGNGSITVSNDLGLSGIASSPIILKEQKDCNKLCKNKKDCHWYSYDKQSMECRTNRAISRKGMIHGQK